MSKNNIKSKVVKKFKATTYSGHKLPAAENILNRDLLWINLMKKWLVMSPVCIQMKAG